MKVLLIVYDNDSYIHWFPQGLAYLASALLKEGHKVEIYNQDIHHYPEAHLTEYLDRGDFDIVGLGIIAGYYQYRKLLKISEAVNRSRKRPFYVLGGHGPSPEPEFFLKKAAADAVVIGEGEETICQLLRAVESGSSLADVDGIAYIDNARIKINKRRALIKDIDGISLPAYELFPIHYYRLLKMPHAANSHFVMPVLSGRGCPFKCTFCYRMDEGFRPRSNQAIIGEIKILKEKYGINYIAFSDELLMSSQERTLSLCEGFLKSGLNIKWDCNGRLNFAKLRVLKAMKKAGCVFINYGIESLDDAVLKNMKKALSVGQIIEGIEATLQAGISPGVNVIFGNLGDNKDTLEKGVEFLLKYDDGAQMRTIRPVTPYPGSELYYEAIRRGLLKDVEDFYENKHINSDLLSINFTSMDNNEFHECLLEANSRLIRNYFNNKSKEQLSIAKKLYLEKDTSFRGFRRT